MFQKKTCQRCNKEIPKKYDFCPYCGFSLKQTKKEDWGMLGKDDLIKPQRQQANPFAGGLLGGGMLNKMLGSAMKMLEKEMQKEIQNFEKIKQNPEAFQPKTNLQIYLNGKKVNLGPNEKIQLGNNPIKTSPKKKKPLASISLPKNELKNFSKLPQETPETNIRRLSDRIIYEINMPGVKNKKDLSITRLENSIEIKALADKGKKAYYKIIKVSLPVINYDFSKEMLILELATK